MARKSRNADDTDKSALVRVFICEIVAKGDQAPARQRRGQEGEVSES